MAIRQSVLVVIGLLIGAGLMAYALWDVDYRAVAEILADVSYAPAAPFMLGLGLFFALKAERWARILTPLGAFSARDVTPAMLIGFAGNNVLPARLGELARSLVFARESHLPLSAVITSLVLERLLDLASIMILYIGVLSWMEDPPDAVRFTVWPAAIACLTVLALTWALLEAPARVERAWRWLATPLPYGVRAAGSRAIGDAIRALGTVRDLPVVALMLANSLAQWAIAVLLIWLSLAALDTSVSIAAAVVVLAALAFAAMLPNAPGYLGATQAAFVLALTPFGVSHEIALAASVVYTVGQWLPVTSLGLLMLFSRSRDSGPRRWLLLMSARSVGH